MTGPDVREAAPVGGALTILTNSYERWTASTTSRSSPTRLASRADVRELPVRSREQIQEILREAAYAVANRRSCC